MKMRTVSLINGEGYKWKWLLMEMVINGNGY